MTTMPHGGPVDRLADLLNDLEDRANEQDHNTQIVEHGRINLLFGHAIFAMLVAPGFAMLYKSGMSAPSFVVMRQVPGAPYSLAALIGLGGLILAVATIHRNRLWEYIALALLLAWYTITFVSFTGAIAVWSAPAVEAGGWSGFSHHLNWTAPPSLYAPIVYAHLAYTMAGQMRTLHLKGLRDSRVA